MASQKEIRMILIGKTGSGKSRTGNSIIGTLKFEFGGESQSLTKESSLHSTVRFGYKLDVVDTPGVFDTERNNFDIQKEVGKSIIMTAPGPHAILLCVAMGRFSAEDLQTFGHYLKHFGKTMLEFTIVVFTKVDLWEQDLEDGGLSQTQEQYVANLPKYWQEFLLSCNNRCFFLNNRDKSGDQIERLISYIGNMTCANSNPYYTDKTYQKVEELLEKEEKKHPGTDRDELKKDPGFWEFVLKILGDIAGKVVDHALKKYLPLK